MILYGHKRATRKSEILRDFPEVPLGKIFRRLQVSLKARFVVI
jgi:hypothetical protein